MTPEIQALIDRARGGGVPHYGGLLGTDSGPLSEDELFQLAQALGLSMDRNFFHKEGEANGLQKIRGAVAQQGGWDAVLSKVNTDAANKKINEQLGQKPPEINLGVTPQDQALVAQSIGAAGDIARRELEATLPTILGQASAQAGASGLTGGSAEGASRGLAGAQAIRSVADLLSQQSARGGEALLNLPLSRAQLQLQGQGQDISRILGFGQLQLGQGSMELERMKLAQQGQQRNQDLWGQIVGSVARGAVGYATGGPVGAAAGVAGVPIPGKR